MRMSKYKCVELVATQSLAQNLGSIRARHQIAGLISVVSPCLVDIFPFINESVLCLLSKNKSQCYFDKSGHIKPAFMSCFKESLVNSFAKLK